jgi:hypothetical protein
MTMVLTTTTTIPILSSIDFILNLYRLCHPWRIGRTDAPRHASMMTGRSVLNITTGMKPVVTATCKTHSHIALISQSYISVSSPYTYMNATRPFAVF